MGRGLVAEKLINKLLFKTRCLPQLYIEGKTNWLFLVRKTGAGSPYFEMSSIRRIGFCASRITSLGS